MNAILTGSIAMLSAVAEQSAAVEWISKISDYLRSFGIQVLVPIILFIICISLGQTFKKSLIAALTFGAAFVGLNMVLGYFFGAITPATEAMIATTGVKKDILDVGWGLASTIAFGTTAGLCIIPVSLAVNLVMLLTKTTKTINVDIWNFWNHAFTASVVTIVSKSLVIGLIAGGIHAALCLIIADLGAKKVQDFYGLPGVSIPHGWAVTSVPIIVAVNWIIDRIPGVKNIEWDEGHIREKWGVFGNPLVLGSILGLVFGILGELGGTFNEFMLNIPKILALSMSVGAVMILIPKMTGLLMEALTVISEVAKKFFKNKFNDRELYIGLDSAILIGHPTTIAASVILIPIVLILSIILPGNRVLALGDLASLAYFVAMVPCLTKGNLFRSIISGAVIMTVVLYVCTGFGSALTQMAPDMVQAGATDITALSAGNWITWVLFQIGKLFGGV